MKGLRGTTSVGSVSGGRVHSTGCAWDPATLTWNIPPPAIDPGVLAQAGPVAGGQPVDLEVKAALTAGDGTYCFPVDSTSGDGGDYESGHGAGQPPALVITVAP